MVKLLLSWYNTRMDSGQNYVYILRCADDTLYTGWTTDLTKRLQAHNEGRGAKYTRGRTPVEIVYHKAFLTKEEAMREEARIKRLSRKEKEAMIAFVSATRPGRFP